MLSGTESWHLTPGCTLRDRPPTAHQVAGCLRLRLQARRKRSRSAEQPRRRQAAKNRQGAACGCVPRRWRAATGAGDTSPETRCFAVAECPDHACHAARQPRLTKNALCLLVPLCATKWLRALLCSILQARTLWGSTAALIGCGSMTHLHKSTVLEGVKGFQTHCY